MNLRLDAAWEIHQFLKQQRVDYAIIGGIAVQRWSEPRFTRDVDLSIATPLVTGATNLINLITGQFKSRSADPIDFAFKTRMILVTASNGVDIDISLALPGYEDSLFSRAVDYEFEPGKPIRLCSPEDLIIHKAVAGRPQDLTDIQGVVDRQGETLDAGYIRQWLREFSTALAMPEISERFEAPWRKR